MSAGSRLREGPRRTAALQLWCRRTAYARPKHCEAGTRAERLFRASSVVAFSLWALLQAFYDAERMRPRISGETRGARQGTSEDRVPGRSVRSSEAPQVER